MLNMDANTDYEAFQTTKKGSYCEHSNCPEIHPYSLLIMAVPLTIQPAFHTGKLPFQVLQTSYSA